MLRKLLTTSVLLLVVAITGLAQGRGTMSSNVKHIVFGDVKVQQAVGTTDKPITLELSLFNEFGNQVGQQRVMSNGRYRFIDLNDGRYYIVVAYEGVELDRFTVDFSSQYKSDLQKDIELQANTVSEAAKAAVINAADKYDRDTKTASLFSKGSEAAKNKKYDEAANLFKQIVDTDAADFPAWLELGTVYFAMKNYGDAEKALTQALARHADYVPALISLGRLRLVQKNVDGAIESLSQAVKIQPTSAQANYFLGEAYLQNKKGSAAVGYLNEAIKLDPVGMADAHLRLATLYNAVGMKDKAALEYEEFLKVVPDYQDKKKLEEYISANKKP
ncbi:MAG TPA: tetratricopeptide repeat protein [Pyrinomonadaceae bacterium]